MEPERDSAKRPKPQSEHPERKTNAPTLDGAQEGPLQVSTFRSPGDALESFEMTSGPCSDILCFPWNQRFDVFRKRPVRGFSERR